MKIPVLPIIACAACAMTVVADTSANSPFASMTTALTLFDPTWAAWVGSLITLPTVIAAILSLKNSIDQVCTTALPLQSDSVQLQWINDGKTFVEALDDSLDISVDKAPLVSRVVPGFGIAILQLILQIFQSLIPGCLQNLSPAFSDNNQPALQTIGDDATNSITTHLSAIG